jgi:hypothetical protein
MEIFTTFPSLLTMEILGNGLFRSLKVDFAFVNRKKNYLNFFSKFNKYFMRRIPVTNSCFKFKITKKGLLKKSQTLHNCQQYIKVFKILCFQECLNISQIRLNIIVDNHHLKATPQS